METTTRKISEIKILENLYPREKINTDVVRQYVDSIDELPAIEINQNGVLIDGAHRLSAYKQAGREEIECVVTNTATDAELYELAIKRNSIHGLQLTSKEKKDIANMLYTGSNKEYLAKLLSVSVKTLSRWLESKDRSIREKLEAAILDGYLSGKTQEEMAQELEYIRRTAEGLE